MGYLAGRRRGREGMRLAAAGRHRTAPLDGVVELDCRLLLGDTVDRSKPLYQGCA